MLLLPVSNSTQNICFIRSSLIGSTAIRFVSIFFLQKSLVKMKKYCSKERGDHLKLQNNITPKKLFTILCDSISMNFPLNCSP